MSKQFMVSAILLAAVNVCLGQSTWNGTTSSAWNVAANWTGGLPLSATNVTIPSGTPNAPSTAGLGAQACNNLTVNVGATLTLGAADSLTVQGIATINGVVTGAGSLTLGGSNAASLAGSGMLGRLDIMKTGITTLTYNGSLSASGPFSLLSGTFVVSSAPGQTLTINNDATFSGGILGISNAGTLDVNGNVTFSGTACTSSPNINCSGNWVGAAAYAPTNANVVTFDGVSQSVSGVANFPGLTVATGSSVTVAAGSSMSGPVLISGTLTTSAASMDANSSVTVNGMWNLGSQSHTVAGNLAGSGSTTGTGTITMDGAAGATLSGPAVFSGGLQINKAAVSVALAASLTLTGPFALVGGTFVVSSAPGQTLTINNNATFSGGTLSVSNVGALDINGNATFSGTLCTSSPDINCSGNWVGAAGYAPAGGSIVTLDGVTQTVSGVANFPGLTVATGSSVTVAAASSMSGPVLISGTLTTSAAPMDANASVTVNGVWNLGSQFHTVAGSLAGSGSTTGTGTITMDGASGATLSGPAVLSGGLQINKAAVNVTLAANLTLTGPFALVGGTFVVSQSPGQTLTVNNSATFSGGTLSISSVGALDINGNVTFSGAACSSSPAINCSGNWVGAAGFAPTNGSIVTLDGVTQTVSGTANFPGLTVATGSSVTMAAASSMSGPVLISGTLTTSAASMDANSTVTVDGTWNLGSQFHTVAGSLAGFGSTTGTGTITMDGASGATLSGPAVLSGGLQINKTAASVTLAASLTSNGPFALISGSFFVSQLPGQTLIINNSATFSGGTMSVSNIGTLDVNGNVTFSGTTCTSSPNINCSGNWVGASGYAPTNASVVTFDGAGQSVSGNSNFPGLTIAVGSAVTILGSSSMSGAVTIDGTLTAAVAAADANSSVAVNTGGVWNIGSLTHTIAGNLSGGGTIAGPGTGTIRFDSGSNTAWSGPSTLAGSVDIAKSNATVTLNGNVTVNGGLSESSGFFSVSGGVGQTLTVNGNAVFAGGALTVSNIGTLDINGDVTFSGTTCTNFPNMNCSGNWVSNGAFSPGGGGTLTFDGAAPRTITTVPAGTPLPAPAMIIDGGVKTVVGSFPIRCSLITVTATGTLSTGINQLALHQSPGVTVVNVNGTLIVPAGGTLALGPTTTLTVNPAGTLSLLGTPANHAVVDGVTAVGGNYALTVNGNLAAKNFEILRPNANGLVVNTSAVIAAPPNDLRGGIFDFPAASANAHLLTLARSAPTNIRYPEFRNTNATPGVKNVSCTTGAAINLTNWFGALAGPAFEIDPGNRIAWDNPEISLVTFFGGIPAVGKATLIWTLATTVDASSWILERTDGGPTVFVAEIPSTGPTTYTLLDQPLTPNVTYTYTLSERLTHDVVVPLTTCQVTPFNAPPPSNVLTVGTGQAFPNPQAAINAAIAGNTSFTIVRISPGTYPGFTIGAVPPGGLRVFGDGAGVVIDTTTAGVVVQNLVPGDSVEISDMLIGSATSPNSGVIVQNCHATVIVDECTVAAGIGQTGVRFSNAIGSCLQRTNVTRGVVIQGASQSAASRGIYDSLVIQTGSYAQTCELTVPSVTVDGTSTRENYVGPMTNIDVPEFVSIGTPLTTAFNGFPNGTWALFASFNTGYTPMPNSFVEMPILLNLGTLFKLTEQIADPLGVGSLNVIAPNDPAILGIPFVLQAISIQPVTGKARLSNAETIIAVL